MRVVWVSQSDDGGAAAQARMIVPHLDADVDLVSTASVPETFADPVVVDDQGVGHPSGDLAAALVALAPDVVVLHGAGQAIREAVTTVQPFAVTVARAGINLREYVLASEHYRDLREMRDLLGAVDHIITPSPRSQRVLRANGIPDRRTTVIPTAIEADDCRAPTSPDETASIGMLGRISTNKNQHHLVEVLTALREHLPTRGVDLHLAGPGNKHLVQNVLSETAQFQNLVSEVSWHGWVDRPLPWFAQHVDVNCHASWTEHCPQAVLEAAVAGVPSVVSDMAWAGGTIDAPTCPVDDPWAWAETVVELLADEDRRQTLAERQQAQVRDEFAAASVAEQYDALFEALHDRHGAFKTPAEVRASA